MDCSLSKQLASANTRVVGRASLTLGGTKTAQDDLAQVVLKGTPGDM